MQAFDPASSSVMVRSEFPDLQFEAPPGLESLKARLSLTESRNFVDIMRVVGLSDAGGPIAVRLVPEESPVARGTPRWISGFADDAASLIVLFPARSPTYPNNTIDDVLRHEVAHILIWRAAGERPVPRWFDEGLAMTAERERRFADQTQFLYELVTASHATLSQVSMMFSGSQAEQSRAYAVAGAFVHEILERFGPASCAEILKAVSRGADFDDAFRTVTGFRPEEVEAAFWQRQPVWTAWVPILGSSTVLWLVITILAILAIYMRRRRNREIERRWEDEE